MKIKEIINLTPHEIRLVWEKNGEEYDSVILSPSSNPARVEMEREKVEEVELKIQVPPLWSNEDVHEINSRGCDESYYYTYPININRVTVGKVYNLPEPRDGVLYLVSRQVAEACPQRQDLVIVDETIRNEKRQIIGAKSLARV